MNQHSILFIGLDTHKEFAEVAYIEDQDRANPVHCGRISSANAAITKLAKQFKSIKGHGVRSCVSQHITFCISKLAGYL